MRNWLHSRSQCRGRVRIEKFCRAWRRRLSGDVRPRSCSSDGTLSAGAGLCDERYSSSEREREVGPLPELVRDRKAHEHAEHLTDDSVGSMASSSSPLASATRIPASAACTRSQRAVPTYRFPERLRSSPRGRAVRRRSARIGNRPRWVCGAVHRLARVDRRRAHHAQSGRRVSAARRRRQPGCSNVGGSTPTPRLTCAPQDSRRGGAHTTGVRRVVYHDQD
jgi:hypothetical protein